MPALDVRTISIIFVINSLVATIVMVALWRQSRKQVSGTHLWLICFALQTAMFLLFALRNVIPDVFSVLVANTGIAVAAFILYLGLERFTACQSPQRYNYIILGVFFCLFTYFTFFQPDVRIRIVLISTTVMLIFLQGSWLMLHRVEPELRPLTQAAGIMCVLYVLNQCYRIVIAFLMPSPGTLLSANVFDTFGQAINATLFIGWIFVLVLMVNRRIIIDFQKSKENLVSSKIEVEINKRKITEFKQAEEVLQKGKANLDAIFESSSVAMFVVDETTNIIMANHAFTVMCGGSEADIMQHRPGNALRCIHSSKDPRGCGYSKDCKFCNVRNGVEGLIANGGTIHGAELELELIRNGTPQKVWMRIGAEPIQLNGRRHVCIAMDDVTERKRAEKELTLNSQRMQVLLQLNQMREAGLKETTDFALEEAVRLTQSTIGYLAFLNEDESVLTMHAWSKSAMAECAIIDKPIIYPVDTTGLWGEAVRQRRPVFTNDYAAANPLKKGYPQGHVAVKRHMNVPVFDGSRIVLVAGVGNKNEEYSENDAQQLTLLMEGMWRLIERRRLGEELQESEARLSTIFKNDPTGIIIVHGKTRIIYDVNDSALEIIGLPRGDVVGKVCHRFLCPAETGCCPVCDLGQTVDRSERVLLKPDGTRVPVLKSVVPIQIKGEDYLLESFIDITDRKQAEEELRIYRENLEVMVAERTAQLSATNKELEAFSYSVSHDLRAPLRTIDGFSNALLEEYQEKLDDTGKSFLERVRKATQRMGLLIDDMLKLSRITQAEMKRGAVDLSGMVREITEAHQKSNPDRAVDVTVQEGIMVQGDAYVLKIAMENLVGNAFKFTGKEAHPRIEFGAVNKDGEICYFIRDNGVGFDMAYVGKLFGAFQRLHATEEFAGTGIGLATVKRIIARHGGQVWAEGEIGKGATFYFTLPL